MSARVVYKGDGEYEGTLFNGVKFWVSHQVPTREWFVKDLKNNGGKIVLLEKHADVLIADHVQKNVPADSVSWKWIEASIKEGKLLNSNDYKIPTVKTGRPGVSSTGPKGSRTPFTQEDKKILIRWVVQQEAAGERIQGNTIYDHLAARYPHHSSQSWRDHWVKNYQKMPRENLPYMNDPDSPPPPTAQQSSVIRPAPSAARLPTRPVAVSSSIPPRGQSNAPKKRVPFSEEDDAMLKQYVFERVRGGEKALGNKIYQEFQEVHPHHSFQSWLDRAKRLGFTQDAIDFYARSPADGVVGTRTANRPRKLNGRREIIGLDADTPPPRLSVPTAANPRYTTPKISADAQEFIRGQQKQQAARARSRTTEEPAISSRPPVQAKSRVLENLEKVNKIRAAKLIQRVWRGFRVRRDIFQELDEEDYQEYYHEHEDHQIDNQDDHREDDEADDQQEQDQDRQDDDEISLSSLPSLGRPVPPPPPTAATPRPGIKSEPDEMVQLPNTRQDPSAKERKFYKNLFEFYDYEGIRPPIKTVDIRAGEPMVMPLWELWTKATTDHSSHECRDWEEIATALGIDWVMFPDVTHQLKAAFDKHLLGYEVRLKDWKERFGDDNDESDDDESDDDESSSDGDSKKAAPAHVSSPVKGPDLPSSPPVAGLKRTLDHTRDSPETSALGPSAKRRRFNPDDEIPCSPEPARRFNLKDEIPCSPEPDRRLVAPIVQLRSSPQRLPLLPRPPKRAVEPETQDFNFDNRDEDPLAVDHTPSQQLRSEMSDHHGNRSPNSDSSSDAFDPPANQPRSGPAATARPSIVRQEPRRRVLPSSYSKPPTIKPSPANTNQQPANTHRRSPASMSPAVQARPAAQPQRKSIPAGQRPRGTPKASSPARLAGQRPRETPKASSPPRSAVTFIKYPPGWQKMVEYYMALGYPEGIVRASLEATTFDTGEAAQLMERLKGGRGIPRDVGGVWTEEDNRGIVLLDSAARGTINMDDMEVLQRVMDERERLVAKHEMKRIFKRIDHLGMRLWG